MLCSERRERPCNYKRIDPIWVSLGGPTGSGGGVRRRRGSGRPHARADAGTAAPRRSARQNYRTVQSISVDQSLSKLVCSCARSGIKWH